MKYYYTDPIKAAWMIKNHQIKLVHEELNMDGIIHFGFNEGDGYNHYGAKDGKFYIHPDCYEMLKPQVGDLIERPANKTQEVSYSKLTQQNRIDALLNSDAQYQIIQRNGMAFFMPECEE